MITLKQVEAFYWSAKLGSLAEAADRLNLAQSTVSKRILELESVVGAPLFDRGSRAVTPTRCGVTLVPLAADLLRAELRFREAALSPLTFSGTFRFGVTELIALTWLPKLVMALKAAFPGVVPEPEVSASGSLFHKLANCRLDLVIGLDPPANAGLVPVPLDSVTLEWMCAPGTGPKRDTVPLVELASYPILTQGEDSGLQQLVLGWLGKNGVTFNRIVTCNSLSVLSALAAAGLGITFLTEQYFRPDINSGRLRIIRTTPRIPPIQYFAVFRADTLDPLAGQVAQIARQCCDFSLRGIPGS